MDVEESIRANPFDGVVLLMGCDKTTPALLMGAASCDLPTIGVSGGPMLNGKFRGEDIGSGTHVWKFTEMLKTGEMKTRRHGRGRVVHVALGRALHDDGHRVDDGVDGRGAGHRPADQRRDSRRRLAPQGARAHGRPAHRRHGPRGSADVEDPHQAGVRERDHGQRRDRRLDQRGRAPARGRRTHRRQAARSTTGTGSAATCPASST